MLGLSQFIHSNQIEDYMKNIRSTAALLGISALGAAAMAAEEPAQAAATTPATTVQPAEQAKATDAAKTAAKPDAATMKKQVGYVIGHGLGQQLAQVDSSFSLDDIDTDSLLRGIKDGMKNAIADDMSQQAVAPSLEAFRNMLQERHAERAKNNLEAGKKFMQENAKKNGVKTTKSGLQYEVLEPGGDVKYDAKKFGDSPDAKVSYEGRLIDGTVFDKSEGAVTFNVGRVVPGFSEALKTMPVGAKWRIVIPAEQAYGEEGPGVIGPNSTLIFDLKLEDLQPAKEQEAPMQLTPEMLQQLQQAQGLQGK